MIQHLLKKKATIILFALLCFNCNNQLFAQQVPDSNEIKANIQVGIDSVAVNTAFTHQLADRMLEASKQVRYPWGIFMNTMLSGVVAFYEGRFRDALKLHQEALVYCRANHFKQKESTVLNNIAKDHIGLGDHQKAISVSQEALKVAQSISDTAQMGQALLTIGQTYNKIGYYNEAIKYCHQAAILFLQKNKYNATRYAYQTIGTAYIDAGQYDSAYHYTWLSLDQYKKASPGAIPPVEFYTNIAICYDSLNKRDSGAYYYLKALEVCKQTGDETALQSVLYHRAGIYDLKGQRARAEDYYKQSLRLTEKYNNIEGIVNVMNHLADLYGRNGNYKNAYAYLLKASAANDSLLSQEKVRAIEEFNAKFETQELQNEFEKKELNNKVANEKNLAALTVANEKKVARRNIVVYIFISVAILLLAGIFFLVKYFRQKGIINANKNNELKQRLLLTQMNPHFIFNSVDNIQSLIHSYKNEEAVSYLTKFSKLTRQILENSRENYITLSEELNMLDNYMTIQKLLYNNSFSHKVTVDDRIDPETILLPPMLTQPFIENAIKHGLKDKSGEGFINIRFYMQDEQLFFEVTDNGSGLVAKENELGQRSLSTQITKERLESIASKKNITIHTLNITGAGSSVQGVKTFFEIPYVHNN